MGDLVAVPVRDLLAAADGAVRPPVREG